MTATTEALEPLDQTAEPGRHSPWLRFGLAFALGLAVALLVAAAALFAYDLAYKGRILPGVRVGDVDLSGLTPEAARSQLLTAFGSLSDGRVVLSGIEDQQVITFAEIERGPDVEALLQAALAIGREGSALDRAVVDVRTALNGATIEPVATFDAAELANRVTAIAEGLRIEPEDSAVTRNDAGEFVVVPGHVGRASDPMPVILALTNTLAWLDAPAEIPVDLGVTVTHPDISAAEAFEAKRTAERVSSEIKLVLGEETLPIDGAQFRDWITFQKTVDGGYEAVVDTTPLAALVEGLATEIDREPANAEFVIEGSEITDIKPSQDGYKLDVPATVTQLRELFTARAGGATTQEVVPVMAVTPPALTTAMAEAAAPQMTKVSEWTTYFPIGEKNGFGANIWIPALDIDGYVVGPGESFDFWDAIGPVTRERGYRDGGAIINGRTEPQGALAGGICSTSTTLFNAVLRGGFEMGARRNHYYYIDRYPLGLDATVFQSGSGYVQTMSWTNDTEYPVLIRGYKIKEGSRGYVKFELYSVPNGRRVEISAPTVKNIRRASDSTQLTNTLPAGTRKRVEFPVDGKQVWRTVTIYEPDGTVRHQTTYYSNYSRVTGVVLVGQGSSSGGGSSTDVAPASQPQTEPDVVVEPEPEATTTTP